VARTCAARPAATEEQPTLARLQGYESV